MNNKIVKRISKALHHAPTVMNMNVLMILKKLKAYKVKIMYVLNSELCIITIKQYLNHRLTLLPMK